MNVKRVVVVTVLFIFVMCATFYVQDLFRSREGRVHTTQWLGGLLYSCKLNKEVGLYFSPLYHEGAWEISNRKKTVLWEPRYNKKVTVNGITFKLVGSPDGFYIYAYKYRPYYNIFD